jgi:predicted CopG family antitoxin
MTNDEEGNGNEIDPLLPPLMPPPGGENLPVLPVTPSGGGDDSAPPTSTTKTTPNADEENTSSLGENTSAGDLVEENITSTVGENTPSGIFVGTTNIPVVANTSTGGGPLYRRCNQMAANNSAGSDLVVAKEEERSVSTVQQSLNGKRKDLSIKSNVHLLQEELEENKDERKKSERSFELHDHHATQLHDHDDNYKHNKGKKEKDGTATDSTSNYASGITFDPSVWFCEISEPHRHQEELRAPITITDL